MKPYYEDASVCYVFRCTSQGEANADVHDGRYAGMCRPHAVAANTASADAALASRLPGQLR